MARVRVALEAAVAALRAEGRACAMPALGMMVEVPAAALTIERFDADFLSIGTNDLIQYLTGASRDAGDLAALQDPLQPAVLALLRRVVLHADAHGLPLSVCGDMAGDVRCIPALVEMGVRCLSVAPAALARVRSTLASLGQAAGGHAA
jgi:phosphoenolpyruvate-protein phosphotransferase (PTS system enzyme I)